MGLPILFAAGDLEARGHRGLDLPSRGDNVEMTLKQKIEEIRAKALKAAPIKCWCPNCGSGKPPIWQERSIDGLSKCSDCKQELRFVSAPTIVPTIPLETTLEICDAVDELISALNLAGGQLRFLPEMYPEIGDCNGPILDMVDNALKKWGGE